MANLELFLLVQVLGPLWVTCVVHAPYALPH